MNINISINVDKDDNSQPTGADNLKIASVQNPLDRIASLENTTSEFRNKMGDDFNPFPSAFVGAYMSHFRITLEFPALKNLEQGGIVSVVSPPAAQTVAWGNPFVYKGKSANQFVDFPLPKNSKLPKRITEEDFIARPEGYFIEGKEMLWLQILNLDATMDSAFGPIRIILGETLLREYPKGFRPSLGVATALGESGFPARLFFNPYAVIETSFGAFRAIHGTLAYGRVTSFPPVGTPVSISDCIPMESISEVLSKGKDENPIGRIVALSHPIDMALQIRGEEAYEFVEFAISKQSKQYTELKNRVVSLPKYPI